MNINDVFDQPPVDNVEEEAPRVNHNVFDYYNSITFTKADLMVDDQSEKQYVPYLINRGLSFSPDTVILGNEINSRPFLDKKLQYQFYINSIRPKKRFNKWLKAQKLESIDTIKEYYGYSNSKARQAVSVLTQEQLKTIEEKLKKGG